MKKSHLKTVIPGVILILIGLALLLIVSTARDSIIISSGFRFWKTSVVIARIPIWVGAGLLLSNGAVALVSMWKQRSKLKSSAQESNRTNLVDKNGIRTFIEGVIEAHEYDRNVSKEPLRQLLEQFEKIDEVQSRLEQTENSLHDGEQTTLIGNRLAIVAGNFRETLQGIEDHTIVANARVCVVMYSATGNLGEFTTMAEEAVQKNNSALAKVDKSMKTLATFITAGESSDDALEDLEQQIRAMKETEPAPV